MLIQVSLIYTNIFLFFVLNTYMYKTKTKICLCVQAKGHISWHLYTKKSNTLFLFSDLKFWAKIFEAPAAPAPAPAAAAGTRILPVRNLTKIHEGTRQTALLQKSAKNSATISFSAKFSHEKN